jgi:hypothetical protein
MGELVSGAKSISRGAHMDWAKGWGTFIVHRLKNLSWEGERTKKKIQGFPHVFTLEKF